ncbi:MAG: TetR/AcrR family transcriptional regulator [Pseudomonadota bacterium]
MKQDKAAARPGYHKGNVRERLVDAAEKILKEEELTALSLRRVAREVGVAPSAVYNHFENRDALLAAVAADGHEQLVEMERAAYSGSGNAEDRIRTLALEYLRFAADNPSLYRLMFSPGIAELRSHPDYSSAGEVSFRLAVELYGEGSYDPRKTAISYPKALSTWAILHGAAMQMLDGVITVGTTKQNSIEALSGAIIGVLLEGVREGIPK